MIRLTDKILIGDSSDVEEEPEGVDAILNVAQDLKSKIGWPRVEYMQVGLVDGPGNETSEYVAAMMALVTLLRRNKQVMVVDHDGGRSLAVVMMYLSLVGNRHNVHPTFMSCRRGWDEVLSEIREPYLPFVHKAHKVAFNKIPFGLLEVML